MLTNSVSAYIDILMISETKLDDTFPHDVTRLTGWVKPGEIWQLNIWICTHTKINTVAFYSFYAEKVFISCVWLIPVSRVRTRPSLFDTDILHHILSDLKFSTGSVPVDISN